MTHSNHHPIWRMFCLLVGNSMTISTIMLRECSINMKTNKLLYDVLQMSDGWGIYHVCMFFVGHEWSAGDFQTPLLQTAVTGRLFYRLRQASALSMRKRTSFLMMYYVFPTGGTPLTYELSTRNFGTRFVFQPYQSFESPTSTLGELDIFTRSQTFLYEIQFQTTFI